MPALWHLTLAEIDSFYAFFIIAEVCTLYEVHEVLNSSIMKRLKILSMSSLEHRELRRYTAVLSFSIAVAALGCVPLVGQVSTGSHNASRLEAKLTPFAALGQVGETDMVSSVLPSPANFFIEVETQTLTGRLTCADPRPAFYNCGHTKQSVWGCKADCFIEPDGSQYVLESLGRSYSVTGDANQIRPFLTDEVAVTGKVTGEMIRVVSITKTSKKATLSGMRSE